MALVIPKENYSGRILAVELGTGETSVTIGGETTLPYARFEGNMPNPPQIAYEIQDCNPSEWPSSLLDSIGKAVSDTVDWAKYCETELGAKIIALRLLSTHPDYGDTSASGAAELVTKVLENISVPLIVLGSEHPEKDAEVLKAVAEAGKGQNLIIGKAQEENYKTVAAAAMANNHKIVAMSQLDVNLAKQLNILLMQLGFSSERIVTDPMSSALGYGLEYTYSVMERIRLAALVQNDTAMQPPLLADIGKNVWKAKETIAPESDMPDWGGLDDRGAIFEVVTATSMIQAGADLLIMRHPEAISAIRRMIDNMAKI